MSLIGIDIGNSGCKAVLFREEDGALLKSARAAYPSMRQVPGQALLETAMVEQGVMAALRECAAYAASIGDAPKALSVTSFGECCVPIDADGNPADAFCVTPEDQRSATMAAQFAERFGAGEVQARTSLAPAAYQSLFLLARASRDDETLRRRTRMVLPWNDYICFRLCGVARFSTSQASRTSCYDVHTGEWIPEYIEAAGMDPSLFPAIAVPGTPLGPIRPTVAAELGLPPTLMVFTGTHDQCAAAVGAGAADRETLMLGLGSYACALFCCQQGEAAPTSFGKPLNIEPHALPGCYASYTYHAGCGAMQEYFRKLFFPECDGPDRYQRMQQAIKDWTPGHAPLVLPEFARSAGAIAGISFGHSREEMLLGAWYGCFFYFRDAVLNAKNTRGLKRICATGGVSSSPEILKLIASILELPVMVNDSPEAGALGCAIMAGAGCGVYSGIAEASRQLPRKLAQYEPTMDCSHEYRRWMDAFGHELR